MEKINTNYTDQVILCGKTGKCCRRENWKPFITQQDEDIWSLNVVDPCMWQCLKRIHTDSTDNNDKINKILN